MAVEKETNRDEQTAKEQTEQTESKQSEQAEKVESNGEQAEKEQTKIEDLSIEQLRQLAAFLQQMNEALVKENETLIKQKEELAKIDSKADQYLSQLVALKNDFNSYRNRVKADSEQSKIEGKMLVLERIFPFIDSLDKARVDVQDGKAFEQIYRQFTKILFETGVEEIEVLNKTFDPNLANALTETEVEESKKGLVVEVYQKGYKYGEKILRYAQVIVGK